MVTSKMGRPSNSNTQKPTLRKGTHKKLVVKHRGNLSKLAVRRLKDWLEQNKKRPYPTDEEKNQLCRETSLSNTQLSNWFINARRRYLPDILRRENLDYSNYIIKRNGARRGSVHVKKRAAYSYRPDYDSDKATTDDDAPLECEEISNTEAPNQYFDYKPSRKSQLRVPTHQITETESRDSFDNSATVPKSNYNSSVYSSDGEDTKNSSEDEKSVKEDHYENSVTFLYQKSPKMKKVWETYHNKDHSVYCSPSVTSNTSQELYEMIHFISPDRQRTITLSEIEAIYSLNTLSYRR